MIDLDNFKNVAGVTGAIWFTSDHHFAHANIIRYCDRPFANADKMNEQLIIRWNSRVGPTDLVFHLGDFVLGGWEQAQQFIGRLHGQIAFLNNTSHHDRHWIKEVSKISHQRTLTQGKLFLIPAMSILGMGEGRMPITLCHYPFESWERSHHGALHLHGHAHGKANAVANRLDVGVDSWDFYPVALEEVWTNS